MSEKRKAPSDAPLYGPPEGRARMGASAFVIAFLVVQAVIPLRWYWGGPEREERFSWRMFSTVSRQICQVEIFETVEIDGELVERSIPSAQLVQISWNNFLFGYHQPAIIRNLLRWHCERAPIKSVRYERTGKWPDGTPIEPYRLTLQCD